MQDLGPVTEAREAPRDEQDHVPGSRERQAGANLLWEAQQIQSLTEAVYPAFWKANVFVSRSQANIHRST